MNNEEKFMAILYSTNDITIKTDAKKRIMQCKNLSQAAMKLEQWHKENLKVQKTKNE